MGADKEFFQQKNLLVRNKNSDSKVKKCRRCNKTLSIYNPGPYCFAHQRLRQQTCDIFPVSLCWSRVEPQQRQGGPYPDVGNLAFTRI